MDYHDNERFQKALLSVCQPGTLILTSGGRLARHLKHRYRESKMAAGNNGWVPPDILSLNAWIREAWNMTWPLMRPLSHLSCLALWKEASSRVPPPEPFLPNLKLFQVLDEAYTVLVRHGLPTEGPSVPTTPLIQWRQEIMQTFEALAKDLKGFHSALLPVHLARAVRQGAVRLPAAIVLAAFEAPAPVEESLFDSLASACPLRRLDLPAGAPEKVEGVVTPSRTEEVAWLTQQLVMDAQAVPLNRIGVVVPNTEIYVPYMKQAFGETIGEPFGQTASSYNISIGTPLMERSLVQAGLLPLRFWAQGEPRTLLLSILLSPYYSQWAAIGRDRIARADRVWREHCLDAGLSSLLHVLLSQSPELFTLVNGGQQTLEEALGAFVQASARTGAEWVRTLETFWEGTGFPVTSDEADTGAWQHLKTILPRIREDLKTTFMSLGDFIGVLQHLLSEEIVHIRGSEEAGIQVLGLIESRGLSFEKLYVLGLSDGSLPRPVRPLPFLDVWERHKVQGATAESQFTFALEAFRHLLACAPDVTLTRPEEEAAEPLAPSPFWAQTVAEETHHAIDLWNKPDRVWARAAWLQQAKKGLKRPAVFPPADPPVEGDLLPETLSVSQLATAFACPFRFYAEAILNVFPLDELILGISPLDRGNRLHRVLALFTNRCRDKGLAGKKDREAMEALLETCAHKALTSVSGEAHHTDKDPLGEHGWTMERRSWMGEKGGAPGLLTRWLDLELERLDEGWHWLCEESSFEGFTFPVWPFSIAGRIDRIDYHKKNGLILWDYKSGEHPTKATVVEHLIDPQIPAYVQAAKENRIAEVEKELGPDIHISVSGGYITLKTPSAVTHKELIPRGEGWDQVLKQWREAVASLGNMLASGQFRAEPYPVSDYVGQEKACQYCPYRPLCGRSDAGREVRTK